MTNKSRTAPASGRPRSQARVVASRDAAGNLDVDALIADRSVRIIVCCGSGGVGKTTTSAALAMRAADAGRRVCVLTIDPARRLAQSMGLTELDNTPRAVDGAGADGGSLDAMMLDMKRTFDEVVESHATPEKAAQILGNPFYQALSSSFAGTQEYMAMEKLGQLHAQDEWDLIVVDTPPSRSALDFLDAPERLSSMLDGRFIKLLLAPAKGPARLLSAGFGMVTGAINKVLGAQVLSDVQTFVAAFDTLFGGFRQRAEATYALLQAPGTAFLVVASPEPAAMREASYFVERLAGDRMPLAGLVVNRVHDDVTDAIELDDARAVARRLREAGGPESQVAELLDVHVERLLTAAREQRERDGFARAHPGVPQVPVTALSTDVHDLKGLRKVGTLLAR
ncbi:ArsA family ATPase [Aeromicrobium alkaliterrae]|uniref:ArsA/GET3 Anion-transporting ATPase-like domain-containing protein n=1 Tax=Aeromicrobium alkaliterrae TaxID=302168 RepID=A0ABN2K5Q8_9ACTN